MRPRDVPVAAIIVAVLTLTGVANASGTGVAAPAGPLAPGSAQSFRAFAASQPGAIGIAVAPLDGAEVIELGDPAPAHAWSTSKVPVLAAVIKRRGRRGLSSAQRREARLAITESDNASILELFGDLERADGGLAGASHAVERLLRASGDDTTRVATAAPPPGAVTTFGQTEWTAANSARFFRALANRCLLTTGQTSFVLGLMEHVIPSESWGLGAARFSRTVAFKGGWGPEGSAYLVRQSGIIAPDSARGLAVAIVAHPPAGADSFEIGTEMMSAAGRWLAQHVELGGVGRRHC